MRITVSLIYYFVRRRLKLETHTSSVEKNAIAAWLKNVYQSVFYCFKAKLQVQIFLI